MSAVEKQLISEEGVRLNSQYGVVDWVKYDFRGFLEDDSCLDGLTQVPLNLTPSSIEYIVEQVEGKTVSIGNWDNKFIKRVNHNKETENAYYLTQPLNIESLNIGFIGLGSRESSQFVYVFQRIEEDWIHVCVMTLYVY